MRAAVVVILLSFSLVNCLHVKKKPDRAGAPESCKEKDHQLADEGEKKNTTQSPLLMAVLEEDVKKVRELIAFGHDVHRKDGLGLSYLHLATASGNMELIEVLVKGGIPVNAKMGKKGSTPAHSAVAWGNVASLEALIKNGADLRIPNIEGKTPEALAKEMKKQEVVEFFEKLAQQK